MATNKFPIATVLAVVAVCGVVGMAKGGVGGLILGTLGGALLGLAVASAIEWFRVDLPDVLNDFRFLFDELLGPVFVLIGIGVLVYLGFRYWGVGL